MTEWEIRHCEARSAVAIYTVSGLAVPRGLPHFARNDDRLASVSKNKRHKKFHADFCRGIVCIFVKDYGTIPSV
jgi:hypothetical protein